jgi:hypothetical protein
MVSPRGDPKKTLKSKSLDAEHEKELEEEQKEEVYRPPHCDSYNPQQPKWIDRVLNNLSFEVKDKDKTSGGELAPLWKALKLTRVYNLSSDDDFDGRILASDNFCRTLE